MTWSNIGAMAMREANQKGAHREKGMERSPGASRTWGICHSCTPATTSGLSGFFACCSAVHVPQFPFEGCTNYRFHPQISAGGTRGSHKVQHDTRILRNSLQKTTIQVLLWKKHEWGKSWTPDLRFNQAIHGFKNKPPGDHKFWSLVPFIYQGSILGLPHF